MYIIAPSAPKVDDDSGNKKEGRVGWEEGPLPAKKVVLVTFFLKIYSTLLVFTSLADTFPSFTVSHTILISKGGGQVA